MATTSGPAGGSGSADREGTPAERVIARFGGIRPMANKLDIAVSTVQGWKERGHIPEGRRAEIRDVARALGIPVDEDELRRATGAAPAEGAATEEAAAAEDASGPEPAAAAEAGRSPVFEGKSERIEEEPRPAEAGVAARRQGPARWPAVAAGAAAGALLGAAVAAGLWFLMPQLAPGAVAPDAASQDRVAALESQLADAEARLGEAEAQLRAALEGVEALEQAGSAEELRATLDEMRAELGALEERSAGMAERLDATDAGQLAGQISALRQSYEELRAGLDEARARIDDNAARTETVAALDASVAALRDEMAVLEERLSETAAAAGTEDRRRDRNAGLLVTLTQLRSRVEAGAPYRAQLSALRTVLGPEPAAPWPTHLEPLDAHAETGIAPLSELRRRFPDLAARVLKAASMPPEPDWLDRALVELEGVVTVRRVGPDVEGPETDAVLARAEAALDTGDLDRAVDGIATLEGAAAQAAAPWLRDARALRDALAALDALQTHLVSRLAQRASE